MKNGHIFLIPAENKNVVLMSHGTGKIFFNKLELGSLVGSVSDSNSFEGLNLTVLSIKRHMEMFADTKQFKRPEYL